MTRLGWVILALILTSAAAFLSMTSFGVADGPRALVRAVTRDVIRTRDGSALRVPVAGVAREALVDSWGDPREGGARRHHGTDIPAPAGTPVLAAASGRVEKLFESVAGGTTLYLRSADRHWTYYYAHLSGYAPGMVEGRVVRAGEILGYVGDTGDAGPGNYHLHFGMTRVEPAERWWQGEDVDPYPLLAAGRLPG